MEIWRHRPSNLQRTAVCPSWMQIAIQLPEPGESAAASEGKLLHEAIAERSTDGLSADQIEMYEWCLTELAKAGFDAPQHEVAMALELDPPLPVITGTADVVQDTPTATKILDWKTGWVAPPSPEDNLQLGAYAAMTWQKYGKPVEATMVMPRLKRVETYTFTQLESVVSYISLLLQKTMRLRGEGVMELKPSADCRYCPVKNICPAISAGSMLQETDASVLTADNAATVYAQLNMIAKKAKDEMSKVKAFVKRNPDCEGIAIKTSPGRGTFRDSDETYSILSAYMTHKEIMEHVSFGFSSLRDAFATKYAASHSVTKKEGTRQFFEAVKTQLERKQQEKIECR
ncbi:DUF2800 domain-containing protein [Pararhizobium sp.]|uniref:DUF2800 domain-containing protein n=1 Tax=Pararhizobium sp. TaxID=1977563 RepID=UPI003D119463